MMSYWRLASSGCQMFHHPFIFTMCSSYGISGHRSLVNILYVSVRSVEILNV